MAEHTRPPIDGGTVLVTGASAGIGRELAVQLAPRAKALVLLARRAGRLEELRTSLLAQHPQLHVLTLPVDLSDENDVDRALAEAGEQAGAVDVLVNNAGVGHEALADQADWARIRNVLRTNVLAVAQLTTACHWSSPGGPTGSRCGRSRCCPASCRAARQPDPPYGSAAPPRAQPTRRAGQKDNNGHENQPRILSGAAIGTIIGTGRADLNSTHVLNPAWPPHARFLRTRLSPAPPRTIALFTAPGGRVACDGFASLDSPPLRQVAAPTAGTG